ncbi:Gfo/Idh/MocA family protein [Tautonia rosea]|uniref:Gfo/Idh/MocA family protein n=1 Tax=Tautonia rosea TaxID=2728037 RepID=UPI0014727A46|nr:Gfo/Idh/MocA family oxidoreductase [Tautonia rosea]
MRHNDHFAPNRRQFLGGLAGLGLASGFPSLVPARAFGAADRVRVGFIGVRNQGTNNLKALLGRTDAEVAALCDVDSEVLANASALVAERAGSSVPTYSDYRELLDQADIDAVLITTPDHWHALPTIDACKAGKDVYCEKPLSLTVAEGRAMTSAARSHNRVVQTGSQQRSSAEFRRAAEAIRNGRIGTLRQIVVGLPGVNFDGPPVPDAAPPAELDYNAWLGPAPFRPFNPKQVHYNFRFFWPYSGGQMTNWGAHHLDIVQWALGRDESGPVQIDPVSVSYHPENWYEVPTTSEVVYTYDDGVQVRCRQGLGDPNGIRFEGAEGSIFVARGKLEADPKDVLDEPSGSEAIRLDVSRNHFENWIACIKDRNRPICDVEIGHRSATVCHLGNIAARLGRPISWDPVRELIANDDEAASMLSRPYRAPWALPG